MQNSKSNGTTLMRLIAVGLLLAGCSAIPLVSSLAQRRSSEKAPKVTGISSRKTASGEVISLTADNNLNGVQTWQDPNGTFHLVLPGSGESAVSGSPNGVKVRRVGNSLEIEVRAKRGSRVSVEPHSNRLDLVVNGGVESQGEVVNQPVRAASATSSRREQAPLVMVTRPTFPAKEKSKAKALAPVVELPEDKAVSMVPVAVTSEVPPPPPSTTVQNPPPPVPLENPNAESSESDLTEQSAFTSFVLKSGWWVTLLVVGALVGLIVWRRHKNSGWEEYNDETPAKVDAPVISTAISANERRDTNRRGNERAGGSRSTDKKPPIQDPSEFVNSQQQQLEVRPSGPAKASAILFGAYRVDQEVGKLVLGQAHRMDVLASRGADDRRAMETSLLKALRSSDTDDDGRRRSRQALEEYGFVARQSASVLLAQDPCERVAAARFLGEVGLSSSLQFLLEALYDTDAIVRTQAIESIGALKLPSAIGALLDIARRYPDVPTSALSNALNACSIECFDTFDSPTAQSGHFLSNSDEPFSSEINQLEPAAKFYDLPESTDDGNLVDTLALLQSSDPEVRSSAAMALATYRVQRSVFALKALTANDPEPAVRAAAVASLGAIDHESVFSSVLVALADEARDVRAAAARAVSRLSFDRADAYARVIETSDAHELADVASACIKTGLAAQALDRLESDDRRQAYEAYSLLSLLVSADQCQPILERIESHADPKACHSAIQLLGLSSQPAVAAQLRQLAVREGMPEQLRTDLMEVVYKIDQMQPA